MSEVVAENKGTVVIFPGSWERIPPPGEGPSNWDRLSQEFSQLGYSALVISSLPRQNPNATRNDYSRAAADEIQVKATGPIRLLLGYSGGGLDVDGALQQLEADGADTSRVRIMYLTASLGRPGPRDSGPMRAAIPAQRNTNEFRDSIKQLEDGRTFIEKRDAKRLLFGRVSRQLAKLALKNLQIEFRPKDDPPLPNHTRHDTVYVWDPKDPVRNGNWVRAICKALGYRIIEIKRGGHAIHLSKFKKLAQIAANFIEQSNDDVQTVGARIPRQLRRGLLERAGQEKKVPWFQ